MAHVQTALAGILLLGIGIGVPPLDGRVEVANAGVVAPLENLAGVNIPGQIDKEIAGSEMASKHRS